MASVDEDGQFDELRPPQFHDGVQGRPDRPSGKQDVVDENDRLAIGIELTGIGNGNGTFAAIVTVRRNIQILDRDLSPFDGLQFLSQPFG